MGVFAVGVFSVGLFSVGLFVLAWRKKAVVHETIF